MNLVNLEYHTIATNGVQLHTAQAGPKNGKPLVLLHGFPEFWYGWKHQIEFLAKAGFRVIAPDQRGYNLSSKPEKISDYDIDLLTNDIVGLIDSLGRQKVCLAGHDWGGIVAWWLTLKFPSKVQKLAVLNSPHPLAMKQVLKNSWKQKFKSWYFLYFQIPFLPEFGMEFCDSALLIRSMKDSSRTGAFSEEDFKAYRRAWQQPNALRSMVHWYRANTKKSIPSDTHPRVSLPTLILWGERDAFLEKDLAEKSIDFCDQGRLTLIPEATHWLQHEEPQKISLLLKDFFSND